MWLELKVINMRLRSFTVVDGGTRILEFELPSAKHAGKSQSDKYLYLKDIKETQNYFSLLYSIHEAAGDSLPMFSCNTLLSQSLPLEQKLQQRHETGMRPIYYTFCCLFFPLAGAN